MSIDRSGGCAPLAALLFDSRRRPDSTAVAEFANRDGSFSVSHTDAAGGCVELLRDGLTFDLSGLAPTAPEAVWQCDHQVGFPGGFDARRSAAVALAPGSHLSGASHLLPVIRVAAALIVALARMPNVQAVAWRPARMVIAAGWFAEAVGVWLAGGPFPVLALTALQRRADAFQSEGLAFLIGQEFTLSAKDGALTEADARVAVRLTDWLVAHGRVNVAQEVVLAGCGAVWLKPDGTGALLAERL